MTETVEQTGAPEGKPFGPYLLLEELGAGASGAVFRAWHKGLQRNCALKMLHARVSTPVAKERFEKEGRSTAKLGKHPNIVQVFDAGIVDDVPYLAMELVQGTPMDRLLKDGGCLPEDDVLELGRKMALALDHAHGRGIVHRDLKPGNVIIDEDGEPQVLDFGLAKDLQDTSEMSQAGTIIGTPAYLPPEQAEPSFGPVDHRSDIYSLGATLYTTLTADLPFRASSIVDTLVKVLTADPPKLEDRGVSRDLQAVIHKAMEKRPDDRYQTALELADDLSRIIANEAPKARAVGRLGKGVRWVKRHPLISGAMLVGVFLALVLTTFFIYQRGEADALWRQLSRQNAKAAADETRALLEPAIPILEEMATLARYKLLPTGDMDKLSQHLVVRFKPRRSLDWISYGRADGEFVGVKRTDDDRVVINRSSAKGQWVKENEVDADFNLTPIRDEKNSYDPRKRPFYALAETNPTAVWTKPYKYWGDVDGVGITSTIADRRGNSVRGVFTVDFRLHSLSEFLRGLDLGEGGQAYLLRSTPGDDAKLSKLVIAGPERAHSVKAPTLVDDALAAGEVSLSSLTPGEPKAVRFESGDVAYLGAFESFEVKGGLRWVTLVAVPETTLGLSTMPLIITSTAGGVLVLLGLVLLLIGRLREHKRAQQQAQQRRKAFLAATPSKLPSPSQWPKPPPRAAAPSSLEETGDFRRDDLPPAASASPLEETGDFRREDLPLPEAPGPEETVDFKREDHQ